MAGYFIHTGKLHSDEGLILSPDNRSYRYGDGLFETIRVRNNSAPLWARHMDRLFHSLDKLQFPLSTHLSPNILHEHVERLLQKNKYTDARIRISFYRGNGGLTDSLPQQSGYVIQSWPIPNDSLGFNQNGLQIGIYPDVQKSTDFLSNLKSNHYLPYVMASLYAKQRKWNDAFLLNHHQRIVDSTIYNIFWVKNGVLYTTPLSEGPIDGVMRKLIMEKHPVMEKAITKSELMDVDEIFLTNAVRGIQWVGSFEDEKKWQPKQSALLFNSLINPLFG